MTNIITRTMAHDRQAGNEGKLGFVPTDTSIVDMEMRLIDFSEIVGTDIELNIGDLSGGTGEQLDTMYKYLKSKNINSNCYYNELAKERFEEGVNRYPYFNALNSDIFKLRIAKKEDKNINRKVFSILRNNPPYMWIPKGDGSVRAESEFFITNSRLDITGGIQIFEVPLHQLIGISNLIRMMNYRYELFFCKFPKSEFDKYKQVVVIMKKREKEYVNPEELELIKFNLENDNIPFIDEIKEPVFKVKYSDFKKTPSINLFRHMQVTDKTLRNGLSQVIENLILSEKQATRKIELVENGKSILELSAGHQSSLLASGRYNGIMGNFLIKGGTIKQINTEVVEEANRTETIETEILKPFIEITNAKGDIVFKDF